MPLKKRLNLDIDMTTRPLLGKLILFSIPLLLTGVLQLLYNAADIIVVGRFAGYEAMAAVGSTGALVNLITNLFIGLSVGALAATARNIGAHNHENVDNIVHTSVLISIVGGVVIGIVGFIMARQFLVWMDTPDTIIELSDTYLKIFFIGMPFNLLFNFGSSILRACGDTKRPLLFLSIAGVINIVLNLVFVILFKMSVAGVALATIISQAVSAVLVIICLVKRTGYGKLNLRKLRINKRALTDILRIGLPAGIQSTIFSLSNVIIQSSINSMGELAIAGNVAASNIEGFIYVSMNSVAQAALTFTGQNFGARKKSNINLVLFQSTALVIAVGLLMGVPAYLCGNFLLALYNPDPAVIAYGIERMSIIAITYFLCGVMEVVVGSLRGIGKSIEPMLISIVGVCAVRIVWISTVFAFNPLPVLLYLSYPVSWLATLLVQFLCFFIVKRRVLRGITES